MGVERSTLNQIVINLKERYKAEGDIFERIDVASVLCCQEGTHNKFYVTVKCKGKSTMWQFLGFYGRNGSTMTGRTFTTGDVMGKIISEKKRKGYTPDSDGEAFLVNSIDNEIVDKASRAKDYVDSLLKEMAENAVS